MENKIFKFILINAVAQVVIFYLLVYAAAFIFPLFFSSHGGFFISQADYITAIFVYTLGPFLTVIGDFFLIKYLKKREKIEFSTAKLLITSTFVALGLVFLTFRMVVYL